MPGSSRSPKAGTLGEGAPLTDRRLSHSTGAGNMTKEEEPELQGSGDPRDISLRFCFDFHEWLRHYWYLESNPSELWECSVYCETLDSVLSSYPLNTDRTSHPISAVTTNSVSTYCLLFPEGQNDPPTLSVHHCSAWHLLPGQLYSTMDYGLGTSAGAIFLTFSLYWFLTIHLNLPLLSILKHLQRVKPG